MGAADLGSGSGETGKEPLLLPVFLKLRDRQVLLGGGGPVASAKLDTLVQTGARIAVVAPEVRDDIGRPGVEIRRRPFEPDDLDGVGFAVAGATPAGRHPGGGGPGGGRPVFSPPGGPPGGPPPFFRGGSPPAPTSPWRFQ